MVVKSNAIYVRFDGGHVYVDRSNGALKRELFLSLAGVTDRDRAAGIGARYLAANREERRTVAQGGVVRSTAELPSIVRPGDRIDGELIQSVSVQLVDDGDVAVTHEAVDRASEIIRAVERQADRLGRGVKSEYARPDLKRQDEGTGVSTTPPGFSQSGPVAMTFSPAWRCPRPFHCAFLEASLNIAGSTPTVVWALRSLNVDDAAPGVLGADGWEIIGTATIAAGAKLGLGIVNRGVRVAQEIVLAVHAAGTGAQDLQVAIRGVTP